MVSSKGNYYRSAYAAVSKITADALLAKALSARRANAGSLLKATCEVNAFKLEENDILGIIQLALNPISLILLTLTQEDLVPYQQTSMATSLKPKVRLEMAIMMLGITIQM